MSNSLTLQARALYEALEAAIANRPKDYDGWLTEHIQIEEDLSNAFECLDRVLRALEGEA